MLTYEIGAGVLVDPRDLRYRSMAVVYGHTDIAGGQTGAGRWRLSGVR